MLKGYKVFYRRNDNSSAHAPEWSVKTVRPNAKATTLGGLDKFAWYNVRVAAFNSKGMGPKSPAVMLKTSEDGKTIVLLFSCVNNNNNLITILNDRLLMISSVF